MCERLIICVHDERRLSAAIACYHAIIAQNKSRAARCYQVIIVRLLEVESATREWNQSHHDERLVVVRPSRDDVVGERPNGATPLLRVVSLEHLVGRVPELHPCGEDRCDAAADRQP